MKLIVIFQLKVEIKVYVNHEATICMTLGIYHIGRVKINR